MTVQALYRELLAYTAYPWLLFAAIFFGAFVLEEGAATLAALLVLAGLLSLATASIALFTGVVVSDAGLYALGYLASRFPWAARWIDAVKLRQGSEWMEQSLLPVVIVSRFLPWALPPICIASGFFGLAFGRFLWLSVVSAALWCVVVLGSLLGFGAILWRLQDDWPWGVGLLVLLAGWLFYRRRQAAGARRQDSVEMAQPQEVALAEARRHPPDANHREVCWFERLPEWAFYLPIVLIWLFLAVRYRSLTLPTAANPSFEAGGLIGESKHQVMSQATDAVASWFAPYVVLTRSDDTQAAAADGVRAAQALVQAGLSFPLVAKPDLGHHGHGVVMIPDGAALERYVEAFPGGETIILQQLVTFEGEAGVFYVRIPGERSGRIFSLNLSEPAHVTGDGSSSLRTLLASSSTVARCRDIHLAAQADRLDWVPATGERVTLAFARSHRLGAVLKDGRSLISPELLKRFDEIADGIPGFFFGRFEVRFRDLEEFRRGEGFRIVEINGAGAEANHIWDRNSRLSSAYATLFEQFRLAFHIGHLNRQRGAEPMGLLRLTRLFRKQQRLLRRLADTDVSAPV